MNEASLEWVHQFGFFGLAEKLEAAVSSVLQSRAKAVKYFKLQAFLSKSNFLGVPTKVELPRSLGFTLEFDARTADVSDIQKIVKNKLPELTPTNHFGSVVYADILPQRSGHVSLFFIRKDTIKLIEKKASELGVSSLYLFPEGLPERLARSPMTAARIQSKRMMRLAAYVTAMICFGTSTAIIGSEMERSRKIVENRAIELRQLAIERAEKDRQTTAVGELAAWGLERKTVTARLGTLLAISEATPDEAWWTGVSFKNKNVEVSGMSKNAATVLKSMSISFPSKTVKFSEPMIDEGEDIQSFSILLEEEE